MKWYDITRIADTGCDFNFIVSGRGPGKSTAMVNLLIDSYFHTESEYGRPAQFARIVRYDWAISRTMMTGWFNEVNKNHLLEYGKAVTYKGGEWRLFPSEDGRIDEGDPYEVMGYVLPLNAQDDYKSGVDFSNVTNVVFEEFVQLRERDYVESETDLFLSALSTIVRNRKDCRCWFIGNTLTKYNPYFQLFGIDVDKIGLEPGDLKTFRTTGYDGKGATIAIEYAQMAHEVIDDIAPLMRISGNVTATTGLYQVDPSVSEFSKRTAKLLDSDLIPALPVAGCYLGGGKFCSIKYTRKPFWDGMPLLVMGCLYPDETSLFRDTFLNLSGIPSPTYEFAGRTFVLKCVSPLSIMADATIWHRVQVADARCAHAYETDEIKYKWRKFVDGLDYERGTMV